MGKERTWKKLLAVVLALSMTCSTQTVSVYADVLGVQTVPSDGQEPETDQQETEKSTETGESGETEISVDENTHGWLGVVIGENVNLRETPDTEADNVAAKVNDGQELTVTAMVTLDNGDQWYRVIWEGQEVYIKAEFVEIQEAETETETETETEAPEIVAVEAQTEAPETEAPQTEAPATEAPQTEAPETEASATEAPETEAPKIETAVYKTNFRFENEEVIVTVNAKEAAQLPENTEMRVEKLQFDTEAYKAAKAAVEAKTGVKESAEYLFYNVDFYVNGQKADYKDGTVTIQIQFKTQIKNSTKGIQTVMHIDENSKVQDVTASVAENSNMSSVNFAL